MFTVERRGGRDDQPAPRFARRAQRVDAGATAIPLTDEMHRTAAAAGLVSIAPRPYSLTPGIKYVSRVVTQSYTFTMSADTRSLLFPGFSGAQQMCLFRWAVSEANWATAISYIQNPNYTWSATTDITGVVTTTAINNLAAAAALQLTGVKLEVQVAPSWASQVGVTVVGSKDGGNYWGTEAPQSSLQIKGDGLTPSTSYVMGIRYDADVPFSTWLSSVHPKFVNGNTVRTFRTGGTTFQSGFGAVGPTSQTPATQSDYAAGKWPYASPAFSRGAGLPLVALSCAGATAQITVRTIYTYSEVFNPSTTAPVIPPGTTTVTPVGDAHSVATDAEGPLPEHEHTELADEADTKHDSEKSPDESKMTTKPIPTKPMVGIPQELHNPSKDGRVVVPKKAVVDAAKRKAANKTSGSKSKSCMLLNAVEEGGKLAGHLASAFSSLKSGNGSAALDDAKGAVNDIESLFADARKLFNF